MNEQEANWFLRTWDMASTNPVHRKMGHDFARWCLEQTKAGTPPNRRIPLAWDEWQAAIRGEGEPIAGE